MSNNALFTIEQVDNKLIITVEAVKVEHPNPTMIRSNDGNTETIEFVNPPLNINTNQGGLDLSKYKRFPKGFICAAGNEVVVMFDTIKIKAGTKAKVNTWYGHLSTIETKDGIVETLASHYLAPLDPSDHPDYKPEQPDLPEPRPMNADEIEDWVRRSLCTGFNPNKLTEHINALVQYELNKAKR